MHSTFRLFAPALALVLSACAGHPLTSPTLQSSKAQCDTNDFGQQCNVRIVADASGPYRCAAGSFRIEPDFLELVGRRKAFIRWTLEDAQYGFCTDSGDGVRLKSPFVADHRKVLESFASDSDDGARLSIKLTAGCKQFFNWKWDNTPPEEIYRYELQFRRGETACVIDPWIQNGR